MIKLKNLLKEDLIGRIRGYEVFKNPISISRMEDNLRAISDPDGNLFVIDSNDVMHNDIAAFLQKKGYKIPESYGTDGLAKITERGYISWARKGNSKDFYLGESYVLGMYPFDAHEVISAIKKYAKKTNAKNPQYNFIVKSIYD